MSEKRGVSLVSVVSIVAAIIVVGGIAFFALLGPARDYSSTAETNGPQGVNENENNSETEAIDPFFLEKNDNEDIDERITEEFPDGHPDLVF